MEYLSKILFAVAAAFFAIGAIQTAGNWQWESYDASMIKWSIAVFVASIAAELIWGKKTRAD